MSNLRHVTNGKTPCINSHAIFGTGSCCHGFFLHGAASESMLGSQAKGDLLLCVACAKVAITCSALNVLGVLFEGHCWNQLHKQFEQERAQASHPGSSLLLYARVCGIITCKAGQAIEAQRRWQQVCCVMRITSRTAVGGLGGCASRVVYHVAHASRSRTSRDTVR